MTATASKLTELLHDEIDEQEALRREVRRIVLSTWDSSLVEMLEIAKGDGSHVGSHITEALQLFMGRISTKLDALTTTALQRGVAAGDARALLKTL